LSFSTPYGCSKGTADQYVQDYGKLYNIPTTVFRMSCIYGNRQFGTSDQGWLAHFARAGVLGNKVTIYGDGTQVRDALYVDDYVSLCKAVMDGRVTGVYNVGGGPNHTISVISAVKHFGLEYDFGPWRPSDQKYYVSDITKIRNATGWGPKIGLELGLDKLEAWTRNPK
jgi:CDP-paratose 2-epimerase